VSDRPIQLLIIDNDPIFRFGLSTALEAFNDFRVVAQADGFESALTRLTDDIPALILLEPEIPDGWQLCEQIARSYPNLPIFLLSATTSNSKLALARTFGVKGYLPKRTAIDELVIALRRIVAGEEQWQATNTITPTQPVRKQRWLARWHQIGLQQIEESLEQVERQLYSNRERSLFDWLYWSGRRRELLVSRWLVEQLLPVEVVYLGETKETETLPQDNNSLALVPSLPGSVNNNLILNDNTPAASIANNTLANIQVGIENFTKLPLEIDILEPDKRTELFYLIFDRFNKVIEEFRLLNLTREEIWQRRSQALQDLLESSLLNFFSQYYTLIGLNSQKIAEIFTQDAKLIQEETLNKIPLVGEVLEYFLLENPLAIDNVSYRRESPEAMARVEMLLQNLIVQIANAVIQIILNNFAEVESLKRNLYNNRYLSSREIARFRNNLSWRYRQETYFEEPKNIFESRYRLFVFNESIIKLVYIYAPRQNELDRLEGIPWLVTIAWELRDALSPRLRSVVALFGKAAVYILTQVIGRAIGLIGRGIIQGVGSTLQESRVKSQKSKVETRPDASLDRK
jgi:DNA-binding NarL/FixJ family response regulator